MKKAFSVILTFIILLGSVGCVSIEDRPDDSSNTPVVTINTLPPDDSSLLTTVPTEDTVPTETTPSETTVPDETDVPESSLPEMSSTESDISEEIPSTDLTAQTDDGVSPLDTRVITAPSVAPQKDIEEIPKDHVIYLTFDDGPGRDTRRLLDILDKYNVKATFFVVNTSYSNVIAEEYKRGHSIGIHCNTHNYYSLYESDEAYFADFNAMYDEIVNQTGEGTCLLRFPGGSSNTVSCFNPGIMTRLTEEVENRGFTYFDWNVSSGDAGQTIETQQVVENVINGVQKHKVSVVLQHDKKSFSVDAVEQIIIWGLENGYTFLPLTKDSPTCHHKIAN